MKSTSLIITLAFLLSPLALYGGVNEDLIYGIKNGDMKRVRMALYARANPNTHDINGRSALFWASAQGSPEITRLLLKAGADPNIPEKNDFGSTPLIVAAIMDRVEIARLLIDAKADVNAVDPDNYSALMWASIYGCIRTADVLLAAGADPLIKAKDGTTAFDISMKYGYPDILRMMKEAEEKKLVRGK